MKKMIIISSILIASISAYSQTRKLKSNENFNGHIIKTNLLGMFTLFYEHPLTEKISVQVGFQYNPENLPKKDVFVISIAPEIRYYFLRNKHIPSGLFSSVYGKYQRMNITKGNDSAKVSAIALGLNLGYQYIFKSGITTEVFVGSGYNIWKDVNNVFPSSFPESDYNFDVRLGIGVGYAF